MPIEVRLGEADDVDAALSVYERSNLARRGGNWPSRGTRLAHVAANLRDAECWFHVGLDRGEIVAMALVMPFRGDRGAGPVIQGGAFLDLIYVLPDRWGKGIGGAVLDAVIADAAHRGYERIHLWTHEQGNERAHRLYVSRGFSRTGVRGSDEQGKPTAEWMHHAT